MPPGPETVWHIPLASVRPRPQVDTPEASWLFPNILEELAMIPMHVWPAAEVSAHSGILREAAMVVAVVRGGLM